MSKKTTLRLITANEVALPPVKWYRKFYIPGFMASRPSPFSNRIRTTKYTILNFIPKNLWEQFHRWANIYFLLVALLNFVPAIEAVGKEVALIPLLFVLVVIGIKDIFEDYRRFKSDRIVNKKLCRVYDKDSGKFVLKRWESVRVGNVVQLLCDDAIPADLLLLRSSDYTEICYIETANIDGETNLKQRLVAPGLLTTTGGTGIGEDTRMGYELGFDLSRFTGRIYCEQPHNKIYDFNGYIETADGDTVGVNRNNLLLGGCVLRNTTAVVGVVIYAGHETKSMLNNSGPRAKRSKLERSINVDVIFQVALLLVLCLIGAITNGIWTSRILDLNAPFFPFTSDNVNTALEGFIRFWTFIIIFQVIVPISLYVTVEIVKFIQVYFINFDLEMYYAPTDCPFQCRALNINEDLGQIQYVFSDKTGTLTENQMLFRCCSVGGVNYTHTLSEELAKVHLSQAGDGPREDVDFPTLPQADFQGDGPREDVDFPKPPEEQTELDAALVSKLSDPTVKDFFTVMAICNTVVVNSRNGNQSTQHKTVTYDTAQLRELKYEAESPDEAALVQAARDYGYTLLSRSPRQCSLVTPEGEVIEYEILHMLDFDSNRKCMSVIVRQKGHSEVILYSKGADSVIFNNLWRPLEDAVTLRESGLEDPSAPSLVSSQGDTIQINADEDTSGGVATGGGEGVGGGIMGTALMRDRTQMYLDDYAKLGLRTLCMARRVLTAEDYSKWLEERHRAEVALEDRDNLLFESACSVEYRLELLGATGIEDKLQTGVPEAISSLQAAGMKVWVLTGDKQETAINIGYSSQLFTPAMEIVILNAHSLDECKSELVKLQQLYGEISLDDSEDSTSSNTVPPDSLQYRLLKIRACSKNYGSSTDATAGSAKSLILDGTTLGFALDPSLRKRFLDVAAHFHSVMCCRATPLQKAKVVELVKCGLGKMTLAIGDGANDVSMIQKADIGVGIAGREGMQAVMASDFAMARFHFLVRLLLVHGHWSYARLARMMLYFFYKNIAFAMVLFWYQIFNAFSGSTPIDSINLLIFNLVYTSLPIIVVGIADQDLPASVLLKEKVFYRQGQRSEVYTRLDFWLTMLDALYQSAVVFFIAYAAYYLSDVGITEFGFLVNTSIVIVVSLHLAIETLHWTIAHHVFLWGSIIFTFVFNYVYCSIDSKQRIMDTLFVMQRASFRAEFWFVLLLTPVIALLPRVLTKVIIQEVCPSPVMAARARWKKTSNVEMKPNHVTAIISKS